MIGRIPGDGAACMPTSSDRTTATHGPQHFCIRFPARKEDVRGVVMKRWNTMAMSVALALTVADAATGAPLRTLPNLQSVTVHEVTFGTVANTYDPNASQLTTRLADPLTSTNTDFTFFPEEYYDVFYSDSNGVPDVDGAFLTIEGVWRTHTILSGGMNIAEAELTFAGPVTDFGDFVASFVIGSFCDPDLGATECDPGSEIRAVDQNLGTFPRFGHTSDTDPNDRFRLTIGFDGYSVGDSDADGLVDDRDNCTLVANSLQEDNDGDGIGDICDADFNDDCVVNFVDLGIIKGTFFQAGDLETDMTNDGFTNFADLGLVKGGFFLPPGPSGVDNICAN
jgi:hypothetical protein